MARPFECTDHPIYQLREALQWDRKTLAAYLGAKPKTVGKWETEDRFPNRRNTTKMIQLAQEHGRNDIVQKLMEI